MFHGVLGRISGGIRGQPHAQAQIWGLLTSGAFSSPDHRQGRFCGGEATVDTVAGSFFFAPFLLNLTGLA